MPRNDSDSIARIALKPSFLLAFFLIIFTMSAHVRETCSRDIESIMDEFERTFNASSCKFPYLCQRRGTRLQVARPFDRKSFLGTEIKLNFSGVPPPPPPQPAIEEEQMPCRCDPDCYKYDDCCVDGPPPAGRRAPDGGAGLPSTLSRESVSCIRLYPNDPYFPKRTVHAVDKCPSTARETIAKKCHKTVTESKYRYVLDLPVVSQKTGLVYANYYCALCHDDYQVNKYNQSFICNCDLKSKSELRRMEYLPGELAWTTPSTKEDNCSRGSEIKVCVLETQFPSNMGRRCEIGIVDSCQDDWPLEKDWEMCSSYNYHVQDNLATVYKNPTCARCNSVSEHKLSCIMPSITLRFGDSRGLDVFLLSDLFSTNEPCEFDETYDIIFEECVKDKLETKTLHSAANLVFLVFMCMSLLAMLLHMVIFFILFKQRNLHTKNLFTMTLSLFFAELLLLICSRTCQNEIGCYISTLVVYFCFLSAFFWMNVMSFDVCKTFRTTHLRSNSHRLYIKYAVYAFGAPTILSVVAVLVNEFAPESDIAPGFGINGFWFANRGGLLLFFCGPAVVIFITNIAMLSVSIYDIFHHQKASRFATRKPRSEKNVRLERETESFINEETQLKQADFTKDASKLNQVQDKIKENLQKVKMDKERLMLYSKLALIMGAPWIFALFEDLSTFCKYLFNILNSLQGVFIFIAFDCKSKLLKEVFEKLGWHSIAESFLSSTDVTSLDDGKNKASKASATASSTSG